MRKLLNMTVIEHPRMVSFQKKKSQIIENLFIFKATHSYKTFRFKNLIIYDDSDRMIILVFDSIQPLMKIEVKHRFEAPNDLDQSIQNQKWYNHYYSPNTLKLRQLKFFQLLQNTTVNHNFSPRSKS